MTDQTQTTPLTPCPTCGSFAHAFGPPTAPEGLALRERVHDALRAATPTPADPVSVRDLYFYEAGIAEGRATPAPAEPRLRDVDRLANVLHDIGGEFCHPFTEYHPIAMHRSQSAAILAGFPLATTEAER